MIDHMTLIVKDLARSKDFFLKTLEPLGYSVIMEFPGAAGLGAAGKPDFWLAEGETGGKGLHIAFGVKETAQVDAFHAAGLDAGGKDNGPPGIREKYHPQYYGAFIIDPDGNNIEAVHHGAAH